MWDPTPEEVERDLDAVRKILAEAGWPEDLADPKEQATIIMRGEPGWLSGPC